MKDATGHGTDQPRDGHGRWTSGGGGGTAANDNNANAANIAKLQDRFDMARGTRKALEDGAFPGDVKAARRAEQQALNALVKANPGSVFKMPAVGTHAQAIDNLPRTSAVPSTGGHGSDNPNMRYVPVGNSGRVRAYNMKNSADAKNYQTHMARNVRRGYPLKDRWA